MERQTDLFNTIIGEVLSDDELADPTWDTLSALVQVEPDVVTFEAFRYTGDGPPVPTDLHGVDLDLFWELWEASAVPDHEPWRACILKVHRDSAQVALELVYGNDAEQYTWQLPQDAENLLTKGVNRVGELLRPKPEDFK